MITREPQYFAPYVLDMSEAQRNLMERLLAEASLKRIRRSFTRLSAFMFSPKETEAALVTLNFAIDKLGAHAFAEHREYPGLLNPRNFDVWTTWQGAVMKGVALETMRSKVEGDYRPRVLTHETVVDQLVDIRAGFSDAPYGFKTQEDRIGFPLPDALVVDTTWPPTVTMIVDGTSTFGSNVLAYSHRLKDTLDESQIVPRETLRVGIASLINDKRRSKGRQSLIPAADIIIPPLSDLKRILVIGNDMALPSSLPQSETHYTQLVCAGIRSMRTLSLFLLKLRLGQITCQGDWKSHFVEV